MRPDGLRTASVFLFSIATLAAPVLADEPVWPVTGPSFAAPASALRTAAAKIAAEPFAETTVFYEQESYSIDAANRVTDRRTIVYRVETQAGVDDWAEIRLRWSPWYQDAPKVRARVIGADGKESVLDDKTVTDGPAREDYEDTYTDERVRKAPLPGVTVGAIVEMETVIADKAPFFSAGGVYRVSFSREVPIVRAELLIEVPERLKLAYKLHELPKAQVRDEITAGVRHIALTQGYLPGRVDSDIALATHNITGPMVEFSTGVSWGTVAAEYRKLSEANIDPEKVKALLPAGKGMSRMETIQKIVARLHKEVRYTGIEFGEASLQPAPAAEVLKRHYGDCKDKAAMLVAMLRAAGIPASLALLDTGPGVDVAPELPGMNQFDHAIVYAPSWQGDSALWIDATAEFAAVGSLPSMDKGRLALIVADGTTELTQTPAPKPDDDLLVEHREVTLAQFGPSHIVETSLTQGEIDADYRSTYGGEQTRDRKEDLERYSKNAYLAKTLTSVTHGDAHDMTKPFALKLDMADARRGNTTMNDAVVGIPFGDVLDRLPKWFQTDPHLEGEKLTPQQEDNRKRAVAARTTEYDVQPFATEWRYSITPPDSFVLRALPAETSMKMGPALLTTKYATDAQGTVTATLRFETTKPRYTLDEALALRDAVLAVYKQDILTIWFDQAGAKLIGAGKIREGLASDAESIAKHPTEGVHHAQMAYAYLQAGLGAKARMEAETAVKLAPKSAVVYSALGWICQFNEIGVRFAQGFDWDCAADAYRKAMALDFDDMNTVLSFAILNEYDHEGERYSKDAHLAEAVSAFRAAKQKDKELGEQYDDNVLFDLFYSGQFKEVLDELSKLPGSATRRALTISAIVAQQGGAQGIAAGLERADHLSGNAQERSDALAAAGYQLVGLRKYPEAAGLFSAAAGGRDDSADLAQKVDLYRDLKPWSGGYLPATDPRSPVERSFMAYYTGTFNEDTAKLVRTRHVFSFEESWRRYYETGIEQRGMLHALSQKGGVPEVVERDILAAGTKLTAEGDDESGHRITQQSHGTRPLTYFVTKEDGVYKMVTSGSPYSEAGNEALYLLDAKREKEARSLLDFTRDRMHAGGGDDPLSGPLLPRFWTVGSTGDATSMRLAAASLIIAGPKIEALLPEVRKAWENAATEEAKTSLALLLAEDDRIVGDGPRLKEVAAELLKKYPDSYVAIGLAGSADELLNNWDDWKQLIDARLARRPDDEALLRIKSQFAEDAGDWSGARSALQELFDKGKATANDYNNYAWSALFDGKIDKDAVKAAQQANLLTKSGSFAELHTLACLYARQGKTTEARDLLLKAMRASNLSAPNSDVWFGFASIYEQYGVKDAAVEAYSKVEKPLGRVSATSTWLLAQERLKMLRDDTRRSTSTSSNSANR